MTTSLQVAIPLFDEFTALDGVGPYEVLQRIPSIDVTFLGRRRGEFRSENGMLGLIADATFDELPEPDVIVFPGGVGTRPLQHDEEVLEWVRHTHATTRLTTSVCTGSLVLGAAGLLQDLTATTHWACYSELALQARDPRRSGWSSTSSTGSSPPPASRAASTWHCAWSSSSSIARRRKQPN